MITISLCVIVKNEEDTLPQCLNSIKDCVDEIIIVDTGSTDRTKAVARQYTDRIFDFEWIDDFSAARNFAFAQAGMDYILWLDADDLVLPEDAEKLIALKHNPPPGVDVVMMRYNTGFDANGKVTFSYFRERLVKRSRGFRWSEPVHECLDIGGHIYNADISVTHAKKRVGESDRNMRIYENRLARGESLTPRGMYYYARELKDHGRYAESAQWFTHFLNTGKGWIEDKITACGDLAKCYMALQQAEDALAAMTRSFTYDRPRAEILCQMGYYFMGKKQYQMAVFWFELVFTLKKNENNWGFQQDDCWGFIPCIECAVCYDHLGEYEKAAAFNARAAVYKPHSPAVLYNNAYFALRLSNLQNANPVSEPENG